MPSVDEDMAAVFYVAIPALQRRLIVSNSCDDVYIWGRLKVSTKMSVS